MTWNPPAFDLQLAVLVGLASWRTAVLLVREAGPWRVAVRFRSWFGVEHDVDGAPISYPDGSPLACVWCTSFWLSPLFLLLSGVAMPVVVVGAAAGVAAYLEAKHNG